MKATTAIQMAHNCDDVEFDEWIMLYTGRNPSLIVLTNAAAYAYRVLVRNGAIEPEVRFEY